jgi:hypothetical protein
MDRYQIIINLNPGVGGVDAATIAEEIDHQLHASASRDVQLVKTRRAPSKRHSMRPHIRELYERLRIGHFFFYETHAPDDNVTTRTPGGCVALGYDPERHEMRVAISVCHEGDVFRKAKGRDKARGRLLSSSHKDRQVFKTGLEDMRVIATQIFDRQSLAYHYADTIDAEQQLRRTWEYLLTGPKS